MSNCSFLKCKKNFQLPIKFQNASLEIDLGRTVLLNILNLKLDPIILPENFTFPTVTLQFSNFSNSNNSSILCSFLNQVNFTLKYNCRKRMGRILTAKMIFNSTKNVSNISTTTENNLTQLTTTTSSLSTTTSSNNNNHNNNTEIW